VAVAALGAIIGGLAGGGKGAAIGAASGGGLGAGVNAVTRGEQVKIPAETLITFKLQSPINVTTSRTASAPDGGTSTITTRARISRSKSAVAIFGWANTAGRLNWRPVVSARLP